MTAPPTGPALPPLAAVGVRQAETPATWRVGQLLAATVITAPQTGRAELRIGNLAVLAQTGSLALSPGQALRLEVASLKQQPVLKLLGLLRQDPVREALRAVLPRQQPLSPLLAALSRLTSRTGASPLGQDVARVARDLLVQLPTAAAIRQPEGLRQALRDSGLLLESKLARPDLSRHPAAPPGELARDFKANLLRLVQALREHIANSAPAQRATASTPSAAAPPAGGPALRPAPASLAPLGLPADTSAPLLRGQPPQAPSLAALQLARVTSEALTPGELQRHVEGALARVQLNQLSSLPQERLAPEWLIELPVRRGDATDVWGLRIARDERDGGQEDAAAKDAGAWTVMLAFDLPGLGPMQSRISLRGDRVSAQFFSPIQDVLPRINEQLPRLQARLQQAGLQVAELTCHQGRIATPVAPAKARILDERA